MRTVVSYSVLLVLSLFLLQCKLTVEKNQEDKISAEVEELSPAEINYIEAKAQYEAARDIPENLIWYGRRAAYLGNYDEAISLYSKGIEKYPEDPRFLRHRGHRYISTRQFEKAIADLKNAAAMIEGTENRIEPDGLPNARGIPVSTLHGNIYYHLGLAYYLKHEYKPAFNAYLKCRNSGSNADNIASSTHWLYMIQRRLGNEGKAIETLTPVQADADIIENFSYYKLCRFYQGELPLDSVQGTAGSPSSDAMKYGLGNWYFYNGEREMAKEIWQEILDGQSTNSFGYIAAESDLKHYYDAE